MRREIATAAVVGASMLVMAGCEPAPPTGWEVDLVTYNADRTDGGNADTISVAVSPDGP